MIYRSTRSTNSHRQTLIRTRDKHAFFVYHFTCSGGIFTFPAKYTICCTSDHKSRLKTELIDHTQIPHWSWHLQGFFKLLRPREGPYILLHTEQCVCDSRLLCVTQKHNFLLIVGYRCLVQVCLFIWCSARFFSQTEQLSLIYLIRNQLQTKIIYYSRG